MTTMTFTHLHTYIHTYIHTYRSGDWFYHFVESFSLVLVLCSMFLVRVSQPLSLHTYIHTHTHTYLHTYLQVKFPHTYDERIDSFGNLNVPKELGALIYLAIPCFVLAVLFHPGMYVYVYMCMYVCK